MRVRLSRINRDLLVLIQQIGHAAQVQGLRTYLVGGCVRDILLRRRNEDLDMVIEGDALAFARKIARDIQGEIRYYRSFGTVSIATRGRRVDLATARKESYPSPGALPVVCRSTLQDDLFRRDFTLNAMAVAINGNPEGDLMDPYGGGSDLRAGKIRVLHPKSFLDDPTRMIRAVRFEQRFCFRMEPKTAGFLRSAVREHAQDRVKPPRYFEAFRKVWQEPSPFLCLKRMHRLGVLDFFTQGFPLDLNLLRRVEKKIRILRKKKFYRDYDWSGVYFSACLLSLPLGLRKKMMARFQLNSRERDVVLGVSGLPCVEEQLGRPRLKPSEVYDILKVLPEDLIFFLRVKSMSRRVVNAVEQYLVRSRFVKPGITGVDVRSLGVASGPLMGKILRYILAKKIDGEIRSVRQELRCAKELCGKDRFKLS